MEANQIKTQNEQTLRSLILQEGKFEFINKEVGKDGKEHTFVRCGNVIAWPSHRVQALLLEKGVAAVDDIKYAEVLADDGRWIPCLVMASGGLKAAVTITAAEL